ncbi:hypothetical protein ANCDUO_03410, partial [Ancylostoma duodenale]
SVVCAACKKIFCKSNALSRHIRAAHKDSAPVTWKKNDEIDVAEIGIQRIREILVIRIFEQFDSSYKSNARYSRMCLSSCFLKEKVDS